MFGFGGISHAPELIILLIIALVIFGPKKLPDLGKGLGQGIKEFRKASTGESDKEEATDGAAAVTAASASTPAVAEAPKASSDTTADSPATKPPAPSTPVTAEHKV